MDENRVRWVSANILNLRDLEQAIPPDSFVIHLAAMTHAGLSLQLPESCFEINVQGTVRVLEACRIRGVAGVVFASTGLVYGVPLFDPVTEIHPTAPLSPYAASKLAAEAAAFAYAYSYRVPVSIARLSNVYGSGGHPDAVHTIIIRQILAGGPVELLDLKSIRDFIHVDDVVDGLLQLVCNLETGAAQVVNLSTGQGYSIASLAAALVEANAAVGGAIMEIRQTASDHMSSVRRLVLSNSRLFEMTEWRPANDLTAGARETIRTARATQRQNNVNT